LEDVVSLIQELIEAIKPIVEALKQLINYLISEPAVAFALSFLLMLVVVREAYGRGRKAPFSVQTSTLIALVFALYGASVLAQRLDLLGKLAAYAILIGLPLVLIFRFLGNRS
jgi:Na+/glutamate symporter